MSVAAATPRIRVPAGLFHRPFPECVRPTEPEAALNHAPIHAAWVRVFHWINAAAVIAMCMSGWQVYNASPIFTAIRFPSAITLGSWLGGALLWHFAIMWVLVVNFLVYLARGIASRHLQTKLFPLSARAIVSDLITALKGKLEHGDLRNYNAVQKFAYLFVIVDIAVVVLSGLTIWKPVQFPVLRTLMGGFDNARVVHFLAMSGLVGFFVVHVVMVAIVPRSLLSMIRGK
jgi:thiosulfate reductase cytochrome b subunit